MTTRKTKDRLLPGTIIAELDTIEICKYNKLPQKTQEIIEVELAASHLTAWPQLEQDGSLIIPRRSGVNSLDRAPLIGRLLAKEGIDTDNKKRTRFLHLGTDCVITVKHLDFETVNQRAIKFSNHLIENRAEITLALSDYECFNVAVDEVERSVDFLRNLSQNAQYFEQQYIAGITTFLPANQPLYATVCFGLVPSFMAVDVHVRPPTTMHCAFKRLDHVVNFSNYFPNVTFSYSDRDDFIRRRRLCTKVVIFTGKIGNGMAIKRKFRPDILLILNGAGHNPLVVADNADIDMAVTSSLKVCLHNQGQDCAAPNAILVKRSELSEFRQNLLGKLVELETCVGHYSNRRNIVGPNTNLDHAMKIAKFLKKNRKYCIYGGEVNVVSGLIKPAVIVKELKEGPNMVELFCPVIIIHPYDTDNDLALYFEDERYKPNAMYVTLFGHSDYVDCLVSKNLHTHENILRNTDLHKVERGFLPYGGLGCNASCIYTPKGEQIAGATLPQRDIYLHLIRK